MRLTWIFAAIWVMMLSSCTKDITVDLPDPEQKIVVEGYIQNGVPPFVLLTRNAAFFGDLNVNDLSAYFVHDAVIKVNDGSDTVTLSEFCIAGLPDTVKRQFARAFGFEFSDTVDVPNICIYTIPNILQYYLYHDTTVFRGQIAHSYGLNVEADGKKLTAHTYLPGLVPIELSFVPHDDPNNDTLVTVQTTFTQPDTPGNFVRYFTQRNSEPMYTPMSAASFDDNLFHGAQYTFPIERGQSKTGEIDFDTYGYFWRGDTVVVKWAQMDKQSYDFWHTIENDGGDNPFSSPVRIKTNISGGGLGVWCGYGAYLDTIIIPR
jgi:hypothetical protein